jgi:hypothetical protein
MKCGADKNTTCMARQGELCVVSAGNNRRAGSGITTSAITAGSEWINREIGDASTNQKSQIGGRVMAGRRWAHEPGKYVLYFTPYYDEEKLAEIFYDDGWCFSSEQLNTHSEYLGSDTAKDAMDDVERLIEDHFEDQIDLYKHLLGSLK